MTNVNIAELRKFVAPEFIYGKGALSLVGRFAKTLGVRKALVVTDPGVIQAGWLQKVLDRLDAEHIPWTVFEHVTPNPKDHEVASGVECYRENECNLIVAVGGGSPMDCAKGIGVSFANNRNVLCFEGIDEVPIPGPPLICIPTTAGSSADVSQFAIIRDTPRQLKIAIISKTLVPDVSLIDPETTFTMPGDLTAATGLDALVHSIEAYVSNASSPVTDIHALAAIPLLTQNLILAIQQPENPERRNNMMLGSLLAGLAFSNASLGLVHSMAHSLGGLLDLPHGVCNAVLLEHVVDFNYEAEPQRYDQIARAMAGKPDGGRADGGKQALLECIVELRKDAGIHMTLGMLGVSRDDVHELAINAVNDPCSVTNPRPLSIQEVEAIYARAL